MALQPATGARDLNPKQVQQNQYLREQLATVYRHWGYDEISPPQVERLDTLMAGGAIASHDVVRLVADDPLGLRPEMTASIARAACTRLKDRPRPLRLCACGTIFESRTAEEGGLCIEEKLHSGVELFGVKDLAAELELLTLLLEARDALPLLGEHQPQLLVGHTALMELVLAPFEQPIREEIRSCLIQYDRLGLEAMELEALEKILCSIGNDEDTDTVLASKPQTKTEKPPLYKVLLLNDDYTPMEFVVYVLERFFGMSSSKAAEIMLAVHKKGVAVVGVFAFEIAETKVAQVMDCASQNQHPLQCTMEKE